MEILAHAKINLTLDITGKREEDSYHLLDMVMQSITLSDTVGLHEGTDGQIRIECRDERIPRGPENTAYRAAEEFFPAYVLFCESLFFHLLDDLHLRSDGSVVAAGQIQSGIALHSFEADQRVDDRIVERVPEVELTRDIGGRNDDGKRDLGRLHFRAEIIFIRPLLIKPVFKIFRIVSLLHFHNVHSL